MRRTLESIVALALLLAWAMNPLPAQARPVDDKPATGNRYVLTIGMGESDNIHKSGDPYGSEISVHVWWERLSGDAPLADVTACWIKGGVKLTSTCKTKTNIQEGGGSTSRRLNLRRVCGSALGPFYWEVEVDVNIVGQPDPDDKQITDGRAMACS